MGRNSTLFVMHQAPAIACAQAVRHLRMLSHCMPVQVDQLADMISTVFMVHSGTNLETFSHLNKSLVITAAEIALHNFFNQVTRAAPAPCSLISSRLCRTFQCCALVYALPCLRVSAAGPGLFVENTMPEEDRTPFCVIQLSTLAVSVLLFLHRLWSALLTSRSWCCRRSSILRAHLS